MLKFTRNKLINIVRKDEETLGIHGVLEDNIYSIEIDLSIKIPDLEIAAVNGKWHRWTTPECPRATQFLEEAVGFRIQQEGFTQKVHKVIGRKACRHFANLLLECCHSAKEAANLARWEDEKAKNEALTFEEFLEGRPKNMPLPSTSSAVPKKEQAPSEEKKTNKPIKQEDMNKGMIIDLHVHSSPMSPCSSAPVDDLIEEAKNIGLDGICLTDHNYVWDPAAVKDLRQKHGFLILRGNEITTDQGDILVFGMDKDIQGIIKLEELREEVLSAGAFMIVAHPFRGFLTFGIGQLGLTPEKAMERALFKSVDAIEILNGKVTERENAFSSEVAKGLGLPTTGGSDAHEVKEVGVYATRFSYIINDEQDLIKALKQGEYSPIAYREQRQKGEI